MTTKIEFFSKVDGLADAFPVIPASQYQARWMTTCRNDFKQQKHTLQPSHLQLCPGIFEIFKHGFMVPMWHDAVIKTTRDRDDFDYVLPSKHLAELRGGDPIGTHPYNITKFLPKRHYSKHAIVKMNTPWNVIAPPGVKFLVLPIPYPDTHELESAIGILDPAISTEINFQCYLNISEGEFVVKAGTPIMYLIPLTEHDYELVVRDMTEKDAKWLKKRDYLNIFGFKLNKQKLKEAFYKHFYGRSK